MKQKIVSKKFYTTSEVADLCNLSPSTLFRAIRNKKIKTFSTPGGHFRITRKSLEDFAQETGIPFEAWEGAQKKVLLFDFIPAQMRMIKNLLEKQFHTDIKVCYAVEELYQFIQEYSPNIIILNLDSSVFFDKKFRQRIRPYQQRKNLKILGIQKSSLGKNQQEGKQWLDSYITKPIRPGKLKSLIRSLIF